MRTRRFFRFGALFGANPCRSLKSAQMMIFIPVSIMVGWPVLVPPYGPCSVVAARGARSATSRRRRSMARGVRLVESGCARVELQQKEPARRMWPHLSLETHLRTTQRARKRAERLPPFWSREGQQEDVKKQNQNRQKLLGLKKCGCSCCD